MRRALLKSWWPWVLIVAALVGALTAGRMRWGWPALQTTNASLTGEGFHGDPRAVAARVLGVEAESLVLTRRVDYGFRITAEYAAGAEEEGKTCAVDEATGAVVSAALGKAGPRWWVRQIGPDQGRRIAAQYLRLHGYALPAEAVAETVEGWGSSSWQCGWHFERQGVRLPDWLEVDVDEEGRVVGFAHLTYPVEVSLTPRVSREAAVATARQVAAFTKKSAVLYGTPDATLMAAYLPEGTGADPCPAQRAWPAGQVCKGATCYQRQALVYRVDWWGPMPACGPTSKPTLEYRVYIDALTGKVLPAKQLPPAPC